VKRGLYSGDLAQVISYDEAKLRATVKLVPRLESNRDKPDVEPEEKKVSLLIANNLLQSVQCNCSATRTRSDHWQKKEISSRTK